MYDIKKIFLIAIFCVSIGLLPSTVNAEVASTPVESPVDGGTGSPADEAGPGEGETEIPPDEWGPGEGENPVEQEPKKGGPSNVDCDLLATTMIAVNDDRDLGFNHLGDMISAAVTDEQVFGQLAFLLRLYSQNEISFTSPSNALSTIAKCKLIPLLGELAAD